MAQLRYFVNYTVENIPIALEIIVDGQELAPTGDWK